MLHELVVALYGCPGKIFVETTAGIKVAKGISFLHPSEAAILDKLCVLGTHYKKLNDFIHLHSYNLGKDSASYCGLYFRVFCNSLNQVLDPYRKSLIDVEKEILHDPHISLTHIEYELAKYYLLFPALDQLVQEFSEKKIHGCLILDLVHRHSISGIPIIKTTMNKILEMCHKQLQKQLFAWLFYGLIVDPYNEFFVIEATDSQDQKHDSVSDMGKFSLNPHMLPSYIPSSVALKILFIGSSSSLFSVRKKSVHYAESIFYKKEEKFAKDLQLALSQAEFSVLQLANVVGQIRIHSAEHLWKIVVEEADFLSQLYMFKDFYFLGRGELFLAFFDQTRELTKLPLTPSTQNDLNRVFQFAARSVMYTDNNDAEKFSLTIAPAAFEEPKVPEHGRVKHLLNFLGLTHQVEWPLHIIFTAEALEKYSQIFRFLLCVRHVQQELQHCWMVYVRGQRLLSGCNNPWHMMFIINNLQYYLQIDVLESLFSNLVEKIKSEKDFEAINHSHRTFLNSIMALCFLNWKPVHQCLKNIMSTCLEFCHTACSAAHPLDKDDEETLCRLIKAFRHQTMVLLKILSVASSQQQYQNLGLLFLRIDYNKYFSVSESLGGHADLQAEENVSTL